MTFEQWWKTKNLQYHIAEMRIDALKILFENAWWFGRTGGEKEKGGE